MKLPVEWLKEHNKKITDVDNLINKLTLAGIECKLIDLFEGHVKRSL